MSVEIQRKLSEILKKPARDGSDFQLLIIVHPSILERLRTEAEKHLIEMEKRYFGKLSFRKDPAMHAEQFKNRQRRHQRGTRQRRRVIYTAR
jgi:ribonuclease G